MKKLIRWFMTTACYKWLLKKIIPYIRLTTYYTSMTGDKYLEASLLVKPGHIILTNDRRKLTSLLIPGEFSHAALFVRSLDRQFRLFSEVFEAVEMTHEDYHHTYLFDLFKESDRVVIIDCIDWDLPYKAKVIEKALSFDEAEYDTAFTLGVEALYCSELIYQADFERRLKVDLTDIAGLGQPYISPDGLLAASNVKVIFDSAGEYEYATPTLKDFEAKNGVLDAYK